MTFFTKRPSNSIHPTEIKRPRQPRPRLRKNYSGIFSPSWMWRWFPVNQDQLLNCPGWMLLPRRLSSPQASKASPPPSPPYLLSLGTLLGQPRSGLGTFLPARHRRRRAMHTAQEEAFRLSWRFSLSRISSSSRSRPGSGRRRRRRGR